MIFTSIVISRINQSIMRNLPPRIIDMIAAFTLGDYLAK
jgi:hypothetical protein